MPVSPPPRYTPVLPNQSGLLTLSGLPLGLPAPPGLAAAGGHEWPAPCPLTPSALARQKRPRLSPKVGRFAPTCTIAGGAGATTMTAIPGSPPPSEFRAVAEPYAGAGPRDAGHLPPLQGPPPSPLVHPPASPADRRRRPPSCHGPHPLRLEPRRQPSPEMGEVLATSTTPFRRTLTGAGAAQWSAALMADPKRQDGPLVSPTALTCPATLRAASEARCRPPSSTRWATLIGICQGLVSTRNGAYHPGCRPRADAEARARQARDRGPWGIPLGYGHPTASSSEAHPICGKIPLDGMCD